MITRIVKMYFRKEEINNFKNLFETMKDRIEAMEGCEGVNLVQDISNARIFFTLSKWKEESNLEDYRSSDLFFETWTKTKAMFEKKAEAWSTMSV